MKKVMVNHEKKSLQTISENELIKPEENAESIRSSLKDSALSEDDYLYYWKNCQRYRFLEIEKYDVREILNKWPEYLNPMGQKLTNIDFKIKYPDSQEFDDNWALFSSQLESLLKKKILKHLPMENV
ncbi:uncharacterized protein LOC142223181 [Haematobia irritans]|uniref:uncharacterized protein LOC142223181 n=1 Tax=Haematobia irritans TaxID=7368 RepID=UPI003F4F7C59